MRWISSGDDGHSVYFLAALPGRCIAISTDRNGIVLDLRGMRTRYGLSTSWLMIC
jgi:hypothetical protein